VRSTGRPGRVWPDARAPISPGASSGLCRERRPDTGRFGRGVCVLRMGALVSRRLRADGRAAPRRGPGGGPSGRSVPGRSGSRRPARGAGTILNLEPSKRGLRGGAAWVRMPVMVDREIESVRSRWPGLAPLGHAGSRHVCRMHVPGRPAMTRGDRREQVARGCCVARRRGAVSVSRDALRRRSSDGPAVECYWMAARAPESIQRIKGEVRC